MFSIRSFAPDGGLLMIAAEETFDVNDSSHMAGAQRCAGVSDAQGAVVLSDRSVQSRGSSASRRPSPSMLKASTTTKIAAPGDSAIQGA